MNIAILPFFEMLVIFPLQIVTKGFKFEECEKIGIQEIENKVEELASTQGIGQASTTQGVAKFRFHTQLLNMDKKETYSLVSWQLCCDLKTCFQLFFANPSGMWAIFRRTGGCCRLGS